MDWKIISLCAVLGVASVGCRGCGGGGAETGSSPTEVSNDAAEGAGEAEADPATKNDASMTRASNRDREASSEREETPCDFFPDDCPPDRSCYLTADGRRRCAQTGEQVVGAACSRANSCAEGMICVGGSPGTCRSVCRVGGRDCSQGRNCIPLEIAGVSDGLGACEPPSDGCTLWPDDSCGLGEQCIVTPAGRRCRQINPDAQIGSPCPEGPTQCQYGQTCVAVQGGQRRCRPKCAAEEPCDEGRCVELDNRPFGFCGLGSGR